MTERETLAQAVARDNYGLGESLHDPEPDRRIGLISRLRDDECRAFEAGWEAAKQYYTNVPTQPKTISE